MTGLPEATRRQTLAWFAAAAASPLAMAAGPARASAGWPAITLSRIAAPGYGTDPDLAEKKVPWPLTLDPAQRALVRVAADMILPADAGQKPPSALGIDAFVDEWVSAPYARQAADRAAILPGLVWLDAESAARFARPFVRADAAQRKAIFDSIAWSDRVAPGLERAAAFFASLRALVILGYYTTPEGEAELGYVGNTPIEGVYPGPGPEPLTHLQARLTELGLRMPGVPG